MADGGLPRPVEFIPLGKEVRGVRVDDARAAMLRDHDPARPCYRLLALYESCVGEYNIELCDDEKFLYRRCIREFLRYGRSGGAVGLGLS